MRFGAKSSWRDDFQKSEKLKQEDCARKSNSYFFRKGINVARDTIYYKNDIELLALNAANEIVLKATGGCRHVALDNKIILIYELTEDQKRFYFDNSAFIKYTPMHITCLNGMMHVSIELEQGDGLFINYHYGQKVKDQSPTFWVQEQRSGVLNFRDKRLGDLLKSGMVRLFNDARKYNKNEICGNAKNYTNFYNNVNSSITRADESMLYDPLSLNADQTAVYSATDSEYSGIARKYGGMVINSRNLDINPKDPIDKRTPRQPYYVLGPPPPQAAATPPPQAAATPPPQAAAPPEPQVVAATPSGKPKKKKSGQKVVEADDDALLNAAIALANAERSVELKGVDESIIGTFYYYNYTLQLLDNVLVQLSRKDQAQTLLYIFVEEFKRYIQQNKELFLEENEIVYFILGKFTQLICDYNFVAGESLGIRVYNKANFFLEYVNEYTPATATRKEINIITLSLNRTNPNGTYTPVKGTQHSVEIHKNQSDEQVKYLLNLFIHRILKLKDIKEILFAHMENTGILIVPLFYVEDNRHLNNPNVSEFYDVQLLSKYYIKIPEYVDKFQKILYSTWEEINLDNKHKFHDLAGALFETRFTELGEWTLIVSVVFESLRFKKHHPELDLELKFKIGQDEYYTYRLDNAELPKNEFYAGYVVLLKVYEAKAPEFVYNIKIVNDTQEELVYNNKFNLFDVLESFKGYVTDFDLPKSDLNFGKRKINVDRDIAYLLKL
jgi:hypothetical protein